MIDGGGLPLLPPPLLSSGRVPSCPTLRGSAPCLSPRASTLTPLLHSLCCPLQPLLPPGLWDWARCVPGGRRQNRAAPPLLRGPPTLLLLWPGHTGERIVPPLSSPAPSFPISFRMAPALWARATTRPSQGPGHPGLAPAVLSVPVAAPVGRTVRFPGRFRLCERAGKVTRAPFPPCAVRSVCDEPRTSE